MSEMGIYQQLLLRMPRVSWANKEPEHGPNQKTNKGVQQHVCDDSNRKDK